MAKKLCGTLYFTYPVLCIASMLVCLSVITVLVRCCLYMSPAVSVCTAMSVWVLLCLC